MLIGAAEMHLVRATPSIRSGANTAVMEPNVGLGSQRVFAVQYRHDLALDVLRVG